MFRFAECGELASCERTSVRVLGPLLAVVLVLVLPFAAFAQQDQPAWQPTHPPGDPNADHTTNDPNTQGAIPKGFTKPAGCTGQNLVAQQLVALCTATPDGYFWRWWDFNIYTCLPDGTPTFRTVEYTRSTNVPCKKANWELTKKVGKSYGEDWIVDNNVYNSENLTDPPGGTGDPPPLGGDRPNGRTATAGKVSSDGKIVEGGDTEKKTDAKTDTNTGTGTEKKGEPKTATTGGGTSGGKTDKHPKKAVKNSSGSISTTSQTQQQQQNTQDLIGIGVGVGVGLGLGGRGWGPRGGDRN